MLKLFPAELKERFVSALNADTEFRYSYGNPFHITLSTGSFLVYLRNLSPAYFRGSPDITRLQLPYLKDFDQAGKQGITLVVLGYDSDNDAFVSWNPARIMQRINTRDNVSLYSRTSIQQLPKKNEFNTGVLTSGEKFIAFDRRLLPGFFGELGHLFPDGESPIFDEIPVAPEDTETLTEITDPLVLAQISPLLQEGKILEAATLCYQHYGGRFKQLTIQDWLALATKMHTKIAEE